MVFGGNIAVYLVVVVFAGRGDVCRFLAVVRVQSVWFAFCQ